MTSAVVCDIINIVSDKSILCGLFIIDIPIKYFRNFIVLPAEGGENNKNEAKYRKNLIGGTIIFTLKKEQ